MRAAGGWSEGELRGRMERTDAAKDSAKSSYFGWLELNNPAKRSYLFGDPAGRSKFEYLAERAWLALPGSINGKAQAYALRITPGATAADYWVAY